MDVNSWEASPTTGLHRMGRHARVERADPSRAVAIDKGSTRLLRGSMPGLGPATAGVVLVVDAGDDDCAGREGCGGGPGVLRV